MRLLALHAFALFLTLPASAQIGVRSSFDSDVGDTWVFLGAENLDDDPANELVLGVPSGLTLSRLIIRDGQTGAIEWDSDEIGADLDIRIAGWTASTRSHRYGENHVALIHRYGDSPFADTDGDGRLDLVFFDAEANRLYIVGPNGWRPETAAAAQ